LSPISGSLATMKCWVVLVCGSVGVAHAAMTVECGLLQEPGQGATVAVGYFSVTNTGNEERELLKIASPVAESIFLRQRSTDAQGVDREWPIASLRLRPHQTVRFAPENGRHLVLERLSRPLHSGMRIPITLQFNGDDPAVTVMMTVAKAPPRTWCAQ
jgi:periplasmic copper chaperone A